MKKIFPLFLMILLMASCQKDPDMSKLSDDFVVFTDYDKSAKFDSFSTFYVPDSVMVIGNDEKPAYWTATEADDVIMTLVKNMESRGYTRTLAKEDADLGVQVSYVESTHFFTDFNNNDLYYPHWWGGYPGYWRPGYWGPSWGNTWNDWYYPYSVTYSYKVGSLLVEMVNLKTPLPKITGAKLPVLWTAYMSGLVSGSSKLDIQLTTRAIEQAFVQSPYIKK